MEAAQHLKAHEAVKVGCTVCGTDAETVVCSADEVEAQHGFLQRFHARRVQQNDQHDLQDRVDFSQDYATNIVSCKECGLLYRNPRPTQESVAHTYSQDRYGHAHLEAAHAAQLNFFRRKARDFHRWLPRASAPHIVEVGSFVGAFLAAGRERGWNIRGIDPGEEVAEFCRDRGLDVDCGTFSDVSILPNSLDGVAIWNTFDQLPDPHPILRMAQTSLRGGGVLVVRIPNGACFRWAMAQMPQLSLLLRRSLMTALAWNNLLTFPYLYGYSLPVLDRLMGGYRFRRLATYPDTLVRISDDRTKWWARREEQIVKWACRFLAKKTMGHESSHRSSLAPWMDVYYRLHE